ncbi:hypothetical protein CS0771_15720 [Catellatospora sp. IY07-71]|uniref:helix-turn-helix transcriptional regulator n=1 Tax=Catellatospora sp. IY07-71 TaxID=2728827 RepID=UPI001BB38F3D|nr:LuxR C-terminal-related transcriptional regulator [Catellatospora sp. IY07-71]BCJ72028.1 hypothetical protein CS0771_15720 [Catellatospora sp. IY07-71]
MSVTTTSPTAPMTDGAGPPRLTADLTLSCLRAAAGDDAGLRELPTERLVALHALTETWARAHRLVAAALDERLHAAAAGPPALTERQRQVVALLREGLTIQAMARRLGLSPRTVGKHLERVYRRLGTSDRLTTVLRAQQQGLLLPMGDGQRAWADTPATGAP